MGSRLRLLIVLRWLLNILPLWWRLLLLLLVLSHRFEAFVGDTEECAVLDAVFDETHVVFVFASSYNLGGLCEVCKCCK